MSTFQFIPLFNSPLIACLISLVIIVLTGLGFLQFLRTKSTNDATFTDWYRRLGIAGIAIIMCWGPATVTQTSESAVNGVDVYIAVDITGSMAVKDATYGNSGQITRLQAANEAVKDITNNHTGASFAGVSFGTQASLDVPLTPDTKAIQSWSAHLVPEPTGVSSGSNLDAPLDTLLKAMSTNHSAHPDHTIVLYYISDGEQTSTKDRRTFSGLRAFVNDGAIIGVGSPQGGTVPTVSSTGSIDASHPITDPTTSSPAISIMDPENLQTMADEVSIPCLISSSTSTVSTLAVKKKNNYAVRQTNHQRQITDSLVWPFAVIAMILLLWEFIHYGLLLRRSVS